jgi:hypothetical protein
MMKWFVQHILLSDHCLVRAGKGVMVRRKLEGKIESRGRNIRKAAILSVGHLLGCVTRR